MKKNIQINLFGTLYNIDEDAYQLLENYLESMKRYFSRQEGGNEIADDIEHRVAELLWAKKQEGMQAINDQVIREIITKIGNPQDISSQDSTPDDHQTTGAEDLKSAFEKAASGAQKTAQEAYDKVRDHTRGKKLYRDPNDKIIAGVCSGLSQYFGGEVTMWRIVYLVLAVCTNLPAFILYIVLWVILPEARTPEDRLRMNGTPVTPDTINRQILQDQHTTPVDHKGSGCLKTVMVAVIILIAIPLTITAIGTIFGSIMGITGGALGMIFGGIAGALGAFYSALFGSDWTYNLVPAASETVIFWWGISLILIALLLTLYCIIRSRSTDHKPLSFAARLIIGIIITSCLIVGLRNIIYCEHHLTIPFCPNQPFRTIVVN